MGGGVVRLDRCAAVAVEVELNLCACCDSFGKLALQNMRHGVTGFLSRQNRMGCPVNLEGAAVAVLSAHFGEQDGFVRDNPYLSVLSVHFEDFCLAVVVIEAEEFRDGVGLEFDRFDNGLLLGGAGAGALGFHGCLKACGIDLDAPLAGEEFGEVERETVGVVKGEGFFAADRAVLALLFKKLEAAVEGLVEAAFFGGKGLFHRGGAGLDFREDRAEFRLEGIDEFWQEGFGTVKA